MIDKKESVAQFSERLRTIVPPGFGREFAKKAGIGYSTVHNYLQAISSPTLENLVLLAKAGNVSVEWLATGNHINALANDNSLYKIPFHDGNDYFLLDSNAFIMPPIDVAHLIAVRVDSNVMEPTFSAGSILIVNKEQKQLRDSKVFVLYKANSYLFKRIQVVPNGYSLNSDNDFYNQIVIAEDSLSTFEIIGEVILACTLM
ncbi:LexA family transcriptional regulator [Morganella psychrotolerans]|uniref:LexA family transcriptional regulator n=1 Tax=Morganella psychrotolerans TaxID=368603 RepID=UPI0039AF6ECE